MSDVPPPAALSQTDASSARRATQTGSGSPGAAAVAMLVVVVLLAFTVRAWWESDLPPLRAHVVFPVGKPGANEPLISTGETANGDFLTVKYTDATTAVLSYDAWGYGGPTSAPFMLQPGTKHTLQVQMPALAAVWYPAGVPLRRLHVTLDGKVLLNSDVLFHRRAAPDLYLGSNPIGGSPAASFGGQITTLEGKPLRGRVGSLYSASERVGWLVRRHGGELALGLILTALAGIAASRFMAASRRALAGLARLPRQRWLQHGTFLLVALGSLWLFANLETGGTFRLTYPVSFGTFFDYQAASLIEGHLDVPEAAIGGEAFIVKGKYYGYFGVTPALLRIPFVLADVGFGKLSRWYMLAYFAASLAAAYALLRFAARMLRGPETGPSRWAVAVFTAAAGPGSTLFYLGCRTYIYHEANLCGATFALWSAYCSMRYLHEPGRRWWIGAAVCGLLSVHARPPSGLFALFLLGCIALYHLINGVRTRGMQAAWLPIGVGALSLLAVLSFNGLSYLKFGTFDGSPLKYSVQFDAKRLAHIDGKNFHLVNLRHNLDAYVLSANFHTDPHFPFFFFDPRHPRSYPEAKIDLAEPIVAMPFAMPALVAFAAVGSVWILVGVRRLRWPVILLWLGVTPMALA